MQVFQPQPTHFENCLSLSPVVRVRWTVHDSAIDIGLEAAVPENSWVGCLIRTCEMVPCPTSQGWYVTGKTWNGIESSDLVVRGKVWHGYGMVWYGWCGMGMGIGMVWYGVAWYGMVWYGMTWHGMVCCGMTWHGMLRHGMTHHTMVCCGFAWRVLACHGVERYGLGVSHALWFKL